MNPEILEVTLKTWRETLAWREEQAAFCRARIAELEAERAAQNERSWMMRDAQHGVQPVDDLRETVGQNHLVNGG